MSSPYRIYCDCTICTFRDDFMSHMPLSSNWQILSGEFDSMNGQLRFLQPGEIAYNGSRLCQSTNGNLSVKVQFLNIKDMKIELRGRRDLDTYVAFLMDFEQGIVSLIQESGSGRVTLSTRSHTFEDEGRPYLIELRTYDDIVMGFINGSYIIDAVSPLNITSDRFSIYVPEIWEDVYTEINGVIVHELEQYPSDPGIFVDNLDDEFSKFGTWNTSTTFPPYYGTNAFYAFTAPTLTAYAEWRPYIPQKALYDVWAIWEQGQNRSVVAPYTISSTTGETTVIVDQQHNGFDELGNGSWYHLGQYEFSQGTSGYVRLGNNTGETDKVVIADAIKFVEDSPITVFRSKLKDFFENPPDRTYRTFHQARLGWELGRNIGHTHREWCQRGYPLYEPLPEEWFKKT